MNNKDELVKVIEKELEVHFDDGRPDIVNILPISKCIAHVIGKWMEEEKTGITKDLVHMYDFEDVRELRSENERLRKALGKIKKKCTDSIDSAYSLTNIKFITDQALTPEKPK